MAKPIPSVKAVFDSALEIQSASERKAYLDQACAGAPEIRNKVEALLEAHEKAGSFLETPASQSPETASYHKNRSQGRGQLSPELLVRVETLCGRFEAEWQAGRRPRLEDYIADHAAAEYKALLEELILIDVAYRHQAGERPAAADYVGRCADVNVAWLIAQVLEPGQTATVVPQTIDHRPGIHKPAPASNVDMVIGPYNLVKKIGEGGMGAVYLADQEQPVRRQVALKIIKPGMDSAQVVARFEAERQALTMMDHLSIAKVFDAGATETGLPYFVMELVQGVPLTRYCDDNNLTIRQRLELFVSICQAVQHAHRKGIIHRDLKPSNILVTLYEGKPIPKVIDFGLAKALGEQPSDRSPATQAGTILGTFEYMSPEQADITTQDVDTRSDIYSLGVILYELLTGTTPLDRSRMRQEALDEVLRRIKAEDAPRPSKRLSASGERLAKIAARRQAEPVKLTKLLRGELDWIALKALEKDRDRRYETALDFGQDVESYLTDEPVKACPASARYRLGKWARKHRALVAGVAGILLFLVGTVGVLLVSNYRVNAALAAEVQANQRTGRSARIFDEMFDVLLIKQNNLGEADKESLRRALQTYESFAAEMGQSRQAHELLADGQFRAASIRGYIGDLDEADTGFRRTVKLYGTLAAATPKQTEYRHKLSLSQIGLGNVMRRLGNWREAKKAYDDAASSASQLVRDEPEDIRYLNTLAESQNDLGLLACAGNHWAEAIEPLTQAIALWETLKKESPTDHIRINFNLAVGNNNLILALSGLKKTAEREEIYRKVDSLLKKLEAQSPSSPEFRFLRVQNLNNAGLIFWDRQEWAPAANSYGKAVQLGTTLAADYPAVPEYRLELARGHFNLALALQQQGKKTSAEQAYRQAIAMENRLVSAYPKVPRYRIELASCYNNLGDLLSTKNKPIDAKEVYELAIGLQEKLTTEFGDVDEFRINLAGTSSNIGNVLRDQGKPADALPWYDKAISLLIELAPKHPSPLNARLFLHNASWDRANALGQLGKHDSAVQDWQRAIDLDDGDDRAALQLFLGTAQWEIKLKKVAAADKAAAGLFYDAAKTHALAALAAVKSEPSLHKQYSGRAVELLRQARSAGYFRKAGRIEQLRKDFDSLRNMQDYQKFLKELSS